MILSGYVLRGGFARVSPGDRREAVPGGFGFESCGVELSGCREDLQFFWSQAGLHCEKQIEVQLIRLSRVRGSMLIPSIQ